MAELTAIAILGGSGFYDLPDASVIEEVEAATPFGAPSGAVTVASLGGRRVLFLARHGRGHHLLPGEINARANLYALKSLGATHVISISAVGSLREAIAPGDVVVPRQFLDRTTGRPRTYFGDGVVAHVSLADPVCHALAEMLVAAGRAEAARVHPQGTYVCIDGPQFGTRAESELVRSWGADVVGMTNLPEARLAREAELCYATLVLPTDYDCWRTREEEVRVADVLGVLRSNVDLARRIVMRAIASLDPGRSCACQTCLDTALVTPIEGIDAAARTRLAAILRRRLERSGADSV